MAAYAREKTNGTCTCAPTRNLAQVRACTEPQHSRAGLPDKCTPPTLCTHLRRSVAVRETSRRRDLPSRLRPRNSRRSRALPLSLSRLMSVKLCERCTETLQESSSLQGRSPSFHLSSERRRSELSKSFPHSLRG